MCLCVGLSSCAKVLKIYIICYFYQFGNCKIIIDDDVVIVIATAVVAILEKHLVARSRLYEVIDDRIVVAFIIACLIDRQGDRQV